MPFSLKCWIRRLSTPTQPIRQPRPDVRLGLEPLEERFMPTAYTVTTTKDLLHDTTKGQVTLRDVLTAISTRKASGNAAAPSASNTISFTIRARGFGSAQTITLTSPLPTISLQTTINGFTQGGRGYVGPPLIVLNGASAGATAVGLDFVAGSNGSVVEGLVIQHFASDGIVLNGSGGDLIAGNYIGTSSSGSTKSGNGVGILIEGGATATTVGGATANLISGNSTGIVINGGGTAGNLVLGNFIGTNKKGAAGNLGNATDGVLIDGGASANTIGSPSNDNVLSGNRANGVEIKGSGTSSNVVLGNFIGTNANGTAKVGNGNDGVLIDDGARGNTVGGSAAPNVISGNAGDGLGIGGSGTSANVVLGNFIGTALNGTSRLGNARDGVHIDTGATANTIGNSLRGQYHLRQLR